MDIIRGGATRHTKRLMSHTSLNQSETSLQWLRIGQNVTFLLISTEKYFKGAWLGTPPKAFTTTHIYDVTTNCWSSPTQIKFWLPSICWGHQREFNKTRHSAATGQRYRQCAFSSSIRLRSDFFRAPIYPYKFTRQVCSYLVCLLAAWSVLWKENWNRMVPTDTVSMVAPPPLSQLY